MGATTAMRLGEICGLRWEHVDLKRRVGIRFHSLRHTAAAAMARAKVPWPTIRAQGGWKSDAMFARYANPTPADQLAAVDSAEFDDSAW